MVYQTRFFCVRPSGFGFKSLNHNLSYAYQTTSKYLANPTKHPPNLHKKSTKEEKSNKARTTKQQKVRVSDREKRKILKMMMSGDRRQRDRESTRLRERTMPKSDQREREALSLRIENEKSERLGFVFFFFFAFTPRQ
jgi:hypothetical protein